MRAARFIFAAIFPLCLAACDDGAPAPGAPPAADAAFTYRGAPIDPICIHVLAGEGEGQESVDLSRCTGSAGASEYTVPEAGLETFEDGAIGYTFKCAEGCMRPPFISYRLLGVMGGEHILRVEFSGGGTGYFSSLMRIVRTGDTLRVSGVPAGGDRCNGGLVDADIVDGHLHYSQNVTPYDVVELAQGNQAGFSAYDDIQACAACCVGEAKAVDGTFTALILTGEPQGGTGQMPPVDQCFFDVYNDAIEAGQSTLAGDTLQAFGREFNARCGTLKNRKAE